MGQAIRSVTVLGAGTMGHGIAQVAAQAGHAVALYDLDEAILARARAAVGEMLARGIAKRKVTADERDRTLAGIATTTDFEAAVGEADLVIEAVPEVLALKRETFARAEARAPRTALLASNTSSLAIGAIAEGVPEAARGRVIGAHFFNPVPIMALLELVVAPCTAPATTEALQAFATVIGKTAIVVRDVPGFATSRLGLALGLEAMRMLEAGVASADDIDRAMELGYRHPMGPLRLTDLVGLDVRLKIAEYLCEALGSEVFRAPDILRTKVANNELGQKTGQGFYSWPA